MLNFRTREDPGGASTEARNQPSGQLVKFRSPASPSIHRRLSPQAGRALEILGHAIEYLADEYAMDCEHKGPLGSADPRVEAIQMLKALNRSVYFSGTEVQPAFRRIRRWFIGVRSGRKMSSL